MAKKKKKVAKTETKDPAVKSEKKNLQVEELQKKNARLKTQIKEMGKPKGIPSVISDEGKIKRPDEVYQESLPSALGKSGPDELDVAEKNALEHELRKYIKRSGGFRKGLPEFEKQRAKQLMEIAGKEKLKWDLSIDIPGYGDTHRSAK